MTSLDIPEILIILLLFALAGFAVHQYRWVRHHH
jgi:hypothetical protein